MQGRTTQGPQRLSGATLQTPASQLPVLGSVTLQRQPRAAAGRKEQRRQRKLQRQAHCRRQKPGRRLPLKTTQTEGQRTQAARQRETN